MKPEEPPPVLDRARLLTLAVECEKPGGADRALDAAIFVALNPSFGQPPWRPYGVHIFYDTESISPSVVEAPEYTGCTDVALGEVQDRFWEWKVLRRTVNWHGVVLRSASEEITGIGYTLPRAICAAMLRAKAEDAR